MEQRTVNAVGLMSGTSLDGLDICFVQFSHKAVSKEPDPRKYLPWTFQILAAHTYSHSSAQKEELRKAHLLADVEREVLDGRYAEWVVEKLREFAQEYPIQTAEVFGFHGPTLFHDVENKISIQLGDASLIAREMNCPVVADFRSADLLAGGRGAPLVSTARHWPKQFLVKPIACNFSTSASIPKCTKSFGNGIGCKVS